MDVIKKKNLISEKKKFPSKIYAQLLQVASINQIATVSFNISVEILLL